MPNISKRTLRRAATKGLSITLTATTTLWLAGSSILLTVPIAQAQSNEAIVSSITGSSPRIAAAGESEREVLGVNLTRVSNSSIYKLGSLAVHFRSADTVNAGIGQSALANIEIVRLYADSSLAGTNGVFDSNDVLVATATRTETGGDVTGIVASTGALGGGVGDTCLDITNGGGAGIGVADFIKIGTGDTAEIVGAGALVTTDCTGGANAAADSFTLDTALVYDHLTVLANGVREVNNELADIGNSIASGFSSFGAAELPAGWELAVAFGDTVADANDDFLNYAELRKSLELN